MNDERIDEYLQRLDEEMDALEAEVDKRIGKAAELREAEYRAECDMAAANGAEPPDFMEWLKARHAEWRAAQDEQWLLEQAMRLMKLDDDRAAAETQAGEDDEKLRYF